MAALKIIRKGLALHKSNKGLYEEVIQMELDIVVGNPALKKNNEDELDEDKKKLCVKKLHTYFAEILNNINDCCFYILILKKLENYKFTLPVQKEIETCLYDKYFNEPKAWHTLAQREYKGIILGLSIPLIFIMTF